MLFRSLGRRFDALLTGWHHWSDVQEIRGTLEDAARFDNPQALRSVVTPISLRRTAGMLAFAVAALSGLVHEGTAQAATGSSDPTTAGAAPSAAAAASYV